MTYTKALIAASLVSVVTLAGAQAPGGGRMRMMGRGMGGMMPVSFLLAREDVQADLKLTDDQKSKLEAAREQQQESMRSAFQEAGRDRDAMRQLFEKMQKESEAEVAKILTPEQTMRTQEIRIQMAGNGAVVDPGIQKKLGLSADQVAKIKSLQEKQREANSAVMEKARNREIEFAEVRAISEKNQKAMDQELAKIMTDAQRAKLVELGGRPFERKDPEDGGN